MTVEKAGFYADFGALTSLMKDAKAEDPKALRAAAQQFESLFTSMMLKSMREASSSIGDSLGGGADMDLYQGMYDQQIAVTLSKGKGLGLADMLVQQLTRTGWGTTAATTTESGDADTTSSAIGSATARNSDNRISSTSSTTSAVTSADKQAIASSPQEFVATLLPQAQQAARQLGVDPCWLVAQAALETGWGQHVPSNADGSNSFNLFGIKASPSWQGLSTAANTLEYSNGTAQQANDQFRAYDSAAHCFSDYASVLGGQRYQAVRGATSIEQFSSGLQQAGYATDPAYAQKLTQVARSVQQLAGRLAQAAQAMPSGADS